MTLSVEDVLTQERMKEIMQQHGLNTGDLTMYTDTTTHDARKDELGFVGRGVSLWGHQIILDGEDGIECVHCEMQEEVPKIFQQSSGFREVVYKMYVLGKFKKASCEREYETDQSVLHDDVINVGYDPTSVHWTTTSSSDDISRTADSYIPKGQTLTIGSERYEYRGDGAFMQTTTGRQYHALDLCHKHGENAFRCLPPAIADQCKQHLADQSVVDDTVSIGDLQAGAPDYQTMGVDVATDNNITIDGTDAMTDAEQQSFRQKLAKKLGEQRNNLIR